MYRQKYALLMLIFVLSACSSKPNIVKYEGVFKNDGANSIYVVSHGWHTGLVIPIGSIQTDLPEIVKRFEGAGYVEFGWGDKGFYQAKEITSGLTLRAIFWPTGSVMHAVAVPLGVDVNTYFDNSEVQRLNLNKIQLSSLTQFVASSFYRNEEFNVVPQKQGLYGDSQFYQGVGDYYLMNTCNKWTAKGLRSFGMNFSPTFKLTAGSVMQYLRNQNEMLKRAR